MPPLKALEQAEFGGVDSRSNPVVMPQNRFLRLRNWLPRPDGHLELREGYTAQVNTTGLSGAIHSIWPYTAAYPGTVTQSETTLPFTNGDECIFFWIGKVPYVRYLDGATNPTVSPTIRGNPILGSASHSAPWNRWSYALGKNGYLYMHNGIDLKFFDGYYLRDIGLPVLTQAQANGIAVVEGLSAPTAQACDAVGFDFKAATSVVHPPYDGPPTLANVISSYMYMAYFDKSNNVLAPSSEPLSGHVFPNGSTASTPATQFLEVFNLPPPVDANNLAIPNAVTLLYYPDAPQVPLLIAGTECRFYSHNSSYAGQFEYQNPADTTVSIGPNLPSAPVTTYTLTSSPSAQGILFNPGWHLTCPGWTGPTNGRPGQPMIVTGVVHATGKADNTQTPIWPSNAISNWVMTVRGQLSIPAPGNYNFLWDHDDGAFIGFGGGATYVSGNIEVGQQTMTADQGYPIMSCQNGSGNWQDAFTVNFPSAGTYPFEIDYCNWENEQSCCLYNGDGSIIVPGSAPVGSKPTYAPSFLTEDQGHAGASLATYGGGTPPTQVEVTLSGHGFTGGEIIVLQLPSGTPPYPVTWTSNGPFAITVIDSSHFTFNAPPDATPYAGVSPITVFEVVQIPNNVSSYIVNTHQSGSPWTCKNDQDTNQNGTTLLPSPIDITTGGNLIPASAIGGAQPGYQFYASIYDPLTGHVGNRVPIGNRIANQTPCVFDISGLPDISVPFAGQQVLCWGNATEITGGKIPKPNQGDLLNYENSPGDSEWCLLIGRTGDGGEVPYAVIDSNGNWVYVKTAPGTTGSITIDYANIDGNSELPVNNYIPPPFNCFWREGDRICGSIAKQPFVFNSGSELDDTTGIFVGDPAQSWSPIQVETFPSAQPVWGGFGYMQESWVFTKGQVAQLSELSGERAWNGPYNFGVIGPHAFDGGWNHLPFWVSNQKQLCTMLPNANGPMAISTEYDAALLQRIGDAYAAKTEVIYYRDALRMIEVLRIKCLDVNGNPFVIVHDFNLRDDSAPFGQAYEEDYQGQLNVDFTTVRVRANTGVEYMWAGSSTGQFVQFYMGGDDDENAFTADAICLRYLGGDRTALKTVEWYGDDQINWYIRDKMVGVDGTDTSTWTELSFEKRPFPGDVESAHWQADLQRPEMIHCYLWIQLTSHAADLPADTFPPPNVDNPMALNTLPHLPLETYGRLYLSAPIIGDTRGR